VILHENSLLPKFALLVGAMMSSFFFVQWRKERERMETVVALLVFRSSFVEERQFSR